MKEYSLILDVAAELYSQGLIKKPDIVDFDCVRAEFIASSWEIANAASVLHSGQWRNFKHGVSGINGRQNGWILPFTSDDAFDRLNDARGIAKEVTGERIGYSTGAAARALLKWAVEKCPAQDENRGILYQGQVAYHDCDPGVYPECELLDMKSCYYQLFFRLPTLKMTVAKNGYIIRHNMTKDEQFKLDIVRQAIKEHKTLRNSVWGTSLGSLNRGTFHLNGVEKVSPSFCGPFQNAALIVARMAWELCNAASWECNAFYSKTDGIIAPDGAAPVTWEKYGINYDTKARGDADIRAENIYRVGNKRTGWFTDWGKWREKKPRIEPPKRLYVSEWLT